MNFITVHFLKVQLLVHLKDDYLQFELVVNQVVDEMFYVSLLWYFNGLLCELTLTSAMTFSMYSIIGPILFSGKVWLLCHQLFITIHHICHCACHWRIFPALLLCCGVIIMHLAICRFRATTIIISDWPINDNNYWLIHDFSKSSAHLLTSNCCSLFDAKLLQTCLFVSLQSCKNCLFRLLN